MKYFTEVWHLEKISAQSSNKCENNKNLMPVSTELDMSEMSLPKLDVSLWFLLYRVRLHATGS